MSKLVLTKFVRTPDKTKYAPYELDCIPEKHQPLFIYRKYVEGKESPDDKTNLAIVKQAFGYQKLNKFNSMTTTTVKGMTGDKKNGTSFIASRSKALEEMYDDLAEKFLTYLHLCVWSVYDIDKDIYVLSTIDYEIAYKDTFLVIEALELLLRRNINDRFNEKYSNAEIDNALRHKKLDIEETVGKKY